MTSITYAIIEHNINCAYIGYFANQKNMPQALSTVHTFNMFVRFSPNRTRLLQGHIKSNFPKSKWKTLTAMCETR